MLGTSGQDFVCTLLDDIPISQNVFTGGELRSDGKADDEELVDGGWD